MIEKVHEYEFPDNIKSEPTTYLDGEPGLIKEVPAEVAHEINSSTVTTSPLNPKLIGWDVHDEIFDDDIDDQFARVNYKEQWVEVYVVK